MTIWSFQMHFLSFYMHILIASKPYDYTIKVETLLPCEVQSEYIYIHLFEILMYNFYVHFALQTVCKVNNISCMFLLFR